MTCDDFRSLIRCGRTMEEMTNGELIGLYVHAGECPICLRDPANKADFKKMGKGMNRAGIVALKDRLLSDPEAFEQCLESFLRRQRSGA